MKQKSLDQLTTQLAQAILDFSKPTWQDGLQDVEKEIKAHFATSKSLLSICCRDKILSIPLEIEWKDDEHALGKKTKIIETLRAEKTEISSKVVDLTRQITQLEAELKLAKGNAVSTSSLELEREKFQQEAAKANSAAAASKREMSRLKRDLAKNATELISSTVSPPSGQPLPSISSLNNTFRTKLPPSRPKSPN